MNCMAGYCKSRGTDPLNTCFSNRSTCKLFFFLYALPELRAVYVLLDFLWYPVSRKWSIREDHSGNNKKNECFGNFTSVRTSSTTRHRKSSSCRDSSQTVRHFCRIETISGVFVDSSPDKMHYPPSIISAAHKHHYLLWWSFSSAPSPRCASHLSHFGRCIIISNTKGAGNLCWRARKARESETQRIYGKEVLTEGLAEEELHSRDTALGGKTTW